MSHVSWIGDFLKIWSDKWSMRVEIKGDSVLLPPFEKVYVTSNYHIKDLWDDISIWEPLMNRFELVEMTEVYE